MTKKILIAALLILIAGTAYAKGMEVTKKAGTNTVTIMLQNDPPVTGENTVAIVVKDAAGKAVTDAKVVIDYGMPAMPGMPAMKYKTDTTLKSGKYAGTINFSMPGSWYVNVKVTQAGKSNTAKLNVDVR